MSKLLLWTILLLLSASDCLALSLRHNSTSELPKYAAMLVSFTPRALAQDILHIVRTIALNAKFGTYKDFVEEFGFGPFTYRGLYITDINIANVEYKPEPLFDKLVFAPERNRVSLRSAEPFIKYTFAFKWAIKMFGIHASFGTGNFTITSDKFFTYYEIHQGLSSLLDVNFTLSRPSISGVVLVDQVGFVDWIEARLRNETLPALMRAVERNSYFIVYYLFSSYETAETRLSNGKFLTYKSYPTKATLLDGKLYYSFSGRLYFDRQYLTNFDNETTMISIPGLPSHETGVQMSPYYVPKALQVHAMAGTFDDFIVPFDMKRLGLTGTLRDFAEALPELETRYVDSTPVEMRCKFSGEIGATQTSLRYPVSCGFSLVPTGEKFLSANVTLNLTYTPSVSTSAKLYASKIAMSGVSKIASRPYGGMIAVFLLQLFTSYGAEKFGEKVLDIPALRYEPLRDYTDMHVNENYGTYMAIYNSTADS